jgi:hypothetical protein
MGKSRECMEAIGISNHFLSRTQVPQPLRERIDKWDYVKLKNFCTTKEMVYKLKNSPPGIGENLCEMYIRQGMIKLNSQNINDPIPMKK